MLSYWEQKWFWFDLNVLSCIEQFRNLGLNCTCCYKVFDELKDIRMYTVYICGGSEQECTSGRKNFIWGPGGEEQQVFSFLQRENRKCLQQFRGTDVFQHMFPISGAPAPGGNTWHFSECE